MVVYPFEWVGNDNSKLPRISVSTLTNERVSLKSEAQLTGGHWGLGIEFNITSRRVNHSEMYPNISTPVRGGT